MSSLAKWFAGIVLVMLILVGVASFWSANFGNKDLIDFGHNDFKYAYINLGDDVVKVDIAKWKDYEGEQLQIITPDGQIYLSSANNIVMVGE